MTNYTMRVPPAFLKLSEVTGNTKYSKIADISGQQLLRSQKATGIFREGWYPQKENSKSKINREKIKTHLTSYKINSRIGYVALAFVKLYKSTGKDIYKQALEQFLNSFEKYQNPDGSFPQDIRNDRIEVHDNMIKGHYHSYIINGIAKAAYIMPEQSALTRIAERLGHYILNQYRQSWGHPYINLHDKPVGIEAEIWNSSSPDAISGLAWLSKITGDNSFRQVACRMALSGMLSMFDCPNIPVSYAKTNLKLKVSNFTDHS